MLFHVLLKYCIQFRVFPMYFCCEKAPRVFEVFVRITTAQCDLYIYFIVFSVE